MSVEDLILCCAHDGTEHVFGYVVYPDLRATLTIIIKMYNQSIKYQIITY